MAAKSASKKAAAPQTKKTPAAKPATKPKAAKATAKSAPKDPPVDNLLPNAKAASKAKAKVKASPKAAPPPQTEPVRPAVEGVAAAAPALEQLAMPDPLSLMSPEQAKAIETLSTNLAKAAMTAQGAFADAALRQAERPAALNPDPFHVTPALTEVMGKLAAQPDRLMRAQADLLTQYMDLWQATARRVAGGEEVEPVVAPAKGDKRFNDPDWSNQPVFDVMKQSYLLTSNWLNGLISEVEDVDAETKQRVSFFTKMLTDAFSPSNFLMSNPAALREAIATNGESLAKGMENFARDLAKGGGELQISQTDASPFKVGENIATAPGKVIFQNELFQLLQFNPTTDEVHEIPLLIFPPWINKWYILDLRPENSMIRWLTAQGFTVFVASWVNPDAELADKSFEHYLMDGVYVATEQVLKQTGVTKINTVGYCIGGTLLSCALAHMAARGDDRINSATFFAAQQDFVEAGDLKLFTSDAWVDEIEKRIDEKGGYLPSKSMADTFNSLRANDLIWSFFVSNYLMGKDPKPFDLLFWNSDQTRMPKALHLFYLRNFYARNQLAQGEMELGGETLDLSKVKAPILMQSSKDDHISPFGSVYRGAKLFGGPVTFVMAGSGHIAGVINHPDAKKYQHWINEALPATVAEWVEGAEEHPGSWWTYWAQWLKPKSGRMIPARDPSKGPLRPIEDAPGSFVRVKSDN